MMVSMKPNVVGCCTTALHKQQGLPAAAWIGHFSTGMERGEVNTVSVQPKGRKTAGGFRHSPVWKIFLHWLYLKSASGLWAWRAFSRWKNSLIRRSFFDISFFFFSPQLSPVCFKAISAIVENCQMPLTDQYLTMEFAWPVSQSKCKLGIHLKHEPPICLPNAAGKSWKQFSCSWDCTLSPASLLAKLLYLLLLGFWFFFAVRECECVYVHTLRASFPSCEHKSSFLTEWDLWPCHGAPSTSQPSNTAWDGARGSSGSLCLSQMVLGFRDRVAPTPHTAAIMRAV